MNDLQRVLFLLVIMRIKAAVKIPDQHINLNPQLHHTRYSAVQDHYQRRPFQQLIQQVHTASLAIGDDECRFLIVTDNVV
ncbi:hypothetical protein D3C80_1462070 [compost metagenome]